jgi:small subunit ribosomal protein S8
MTMTDPISDLLTRVRNAVSTDRMRVTLPHSRVKEAVAVVLKREGFIEDVRVAEGALGRKGKPLGKTMTVFLKYGPNGEKIINRIERVSKPGCRVYQAVKSIPKVMGGMGIVIVSTSKGMFSDRECREQKLGGEAIARVW